MNFSSDSGGYRRWLFCNFPFFFKCCKNSKWNKWNTSFSLFCWTQLFLWLFRDFSCCWRSLVVCIFLPIETNACNLSIWEGEAGGWLSGDWARPVQLGKQRRTLSHQNIPLCWFTSEQGAKFVVTYKFLSSSLI